MFTKKSKLCHSIPLCAKRYASSHLTKECTDFLNKIGLSGMEIVHNPTVGELYEYAMQPEHIKSVDHSIFKTTITDTGALLCSSGLRMGRSPKDKRIVIDDETRDTVNWGDVNRPLDTEAYFLNRQRAIDFLKIQQRVFVIDQYAGWDENYRIKVRLLCARPYHALFLKQMLIRGPAAQITKDFSVKGPDFTIINSGEFMADPHVKDVTGSTTVDLNFTENEAVILGSSYAGEMKKGVFSVMHYLMPKRKALSMHCSANVGVDGDTTILFGLSGTGKTTLSSDPNRTLIGDDEHVWTDKGLFNIEGGCYAKCDGLKFEKEPEIFKAVKFGAVLENCKYYEDDPDRTRTINYDDVSLTENTRVCYPLEHIENVRMPAIAGHPKNVIFLTCDATGVLPPVAQLSPEQAQYHFMSGYTSKVAGTEMGIKEPVPTFSACFGEAFLPLHPFVYAEMLEKLCKEHHVKVWLINTGWVRGPYGVGQRMDLKQTRAIIQGIHDSSLDMSEHQIMRRFQLKVPIKVRGVPSELLRPIESWADKEAYKKASIDLALKFNKNFQRYIGGVPSTLIKYGGPNLDL